MRMIRICPKTLHSPSPLTLPCLNAKGIQDTVDTLRDFGHKDAEIKTAIIKRYNLSLEEAEDYIQNK